MRRYLFGNVILDAPDSHKIREIHRQDVLYDRGFGAILKRLSARAPDSVFLDIGANIGDTAALLAAHATNPIVSVEGGEEFITYLRTNAALIGPQVSIVERFVRSDSLAEHRLHYSSGSGTGALQLASAAQSAGLDDSRFISVRDLLTLATQRGPGVGLIKSDTDGVDGFLAIDYLRETDCPLFFECDTVHPVAGLPSPWPMVFDALTARGYSVVIYDNFGLPICAVRDNPGAVLRDFSGYIHMQHCVQPVRIYYLDVWAFPPSASDLFEDVARDLRDRMLRPHAF